MIRYSKHLLIFGLLGIVGACLSPPVREHSIELPTGRWLFLGDSITQAGDFVDYIETWLLLNESEPPEIIDLGLSSETVSGLSESDHPFPRPYLHNRLDKVLERTRPDVVIACYGMNCGIYHPFSAERFAAYQAGINRLIAKVQVAGAEIVLLTPPPYAGRVKPKTPPAEGEDYGFRTPAEDYDAVLAHYAEWILSLDGKDGVRALDVRSGLETYMEASYPKEPIHPAPYGHNLMGEAFLRGIGKDTGSALLETGENPFANDAKWNRLQGLVQRQREFADRALLNDIGHGNPGVRSRYTLPLSDAEELAKPIERKIKALLAGEDTSPRRVWDLDTLFQTPEWRETDEAAQPGMTGLFYSSIPYKGKPVEVFAYYRAPEGPAPEGGWPAVVCVHGGGGTAFHEWVEKWNEHGYAAISMDLEGHLPLRETEEPKSPRLSTPHPGPSRVGVFNDFEKPLDAQWYTHAVAQVVLAHSLLRSFPAVNPDKIGLTGISWGGNLTSTLMGVDDRFAFAIPVYGCGFLPDSDGHQGETIKPGLHTEVVNRYFDGSAYFENVRIPTLWINGTNDKHFPLPSTQHSSQSVNGPATLRYELEMPHGHRPGWAPEEIYAFADSVVIGGPSLLRVGRPRVTEDGSVRVSIDLPEAVEKVELLVTRDLGAWPKRVWEVVAASIEGAGATAEIPGGATAVFFNITDSRGWMVSSEFKEF